MILCVYCPPVTMLTPIYSVNIPQLSSHCDWRFKKVQHFIIPTETLERPTLYFATVFAMHFYDIVEFKGLLLKLIITYRRDYADKI